MPEPTTPQEPLVLVVGPKDRPLVVVVDDEPSICHSLADLLRRDYRVIATTSPQRALDVLRDRQVALLITDQRMPSMSGAALLATARRVAPATPRLLVTGYSDLDALSRSVNEGGLDHYVGKPWDADDLLEIVAGATARYQLLVEHQRLVAEVAAASSQRMAAPDLDPRRPHDDLQRDNAKLRESLTNLRDAFWHLEKIQEVLPFCVQCKRVRVEGRGWVSADAFLQTSSGFITHGFCNECTHGPELQAARGPSADGALGLLEAFVARSGSTMLLQLDASGRIVRCSGAVRALLERGDDTLVGAPVAEVLTAADASALQRRMAGEPCSTDRFLLNFVDAKCRPVTLECHLDRQAERWTLIGEPPRRQDDALQAQLLELNNELTMLMRENARKGRELQQAMDQLKQAQAMLVHQEKMASLGRVTAGVAHEINNPLAFVISNHVTLQRDFDDVQRVVDVVRDRLDDLQAACPQVAEQVREVSGEVDLPYLCEAFRTKIDHNLDGLRRIKQIVTDLRRFARLDEVSSKPTVLAETLRATIRFITPLLEEREVRLAADLPELPPIVCNAGQINQVVDILLTNAVQASGAGQEVRLTIREEGDGQVVEVSDEGEGIGPENLAKVFDPFFTTRPVGAGTGLGLYIAHQVVAEHKGRIDLESRPGEGTRVRITLPARDA